jgi:outer membrane receptor for monomeric catechols
VTTRLSVLANYAYTDAAVTAATDGTVGQRLPMAPRHAGNVWATWRASLLGRTLALSGGANHVGARATLDGPGFTVPAYTTADAAARVTLDAAGRLELAVNGYNLADRRFVIGSFGRDANWLGAPRSVRVALRTTF